MADSNVDIIHRVTVRPHNQTRILLGSYSTDEKVGGFSVSIPDHIPEDMIATEVIKLDTSTGYKLFMHIANFGDTPVNVAVEWL